MNNMERNGQLKLSREYQHTRFEKTTIVKGYELFLKSARLESVRPKRLVLSQTANGIETRFKTIDEFLDHFRSGLGAYCFDITFDGGRSFELTFYQWLSQLEIELDKPAPVLEEIALVFGSSTEIGQLGTDKQLVEMASATEKLVHTIREANIPWTTRAKRYSRTRFSIDDVVAARDLFLSKYKAQGAEAEFRLEIGFPGETWIFPRQEEFFSQYDEKTNYAKFVVDAGSNAYLKIEYEDEDTVVAARLRSREDLSEVFSIFDSGRNLKRDEAKARGDWEEQVSIFIGHGRSNDWKTLKDHLSEKHGFKVQAYETGPRAGFAITELLERLAATSTIALLVLSAEDIGADEVIRARENVIHETGFFQGKLGFKRAIILLEESCNEFSNVAGLQQVRFKKGNIESTFGEILAILRREFKK